jgi:hypothetical protein
MTLFCVSTYGMILQYIMLVPEYIAERQASHTPARASVPTHPHTHARAHALLQVMYKECENSSCS